MESDQKIHKLPGNNINLLSRLPCSNHQTQIVVMLSIRKTEGKAWSGGVLGVSTELVVNVVDRKARRERHPRLARYDGGDP
jgi:hypothetical protein